MKLIKIVDVIIAILWLIILPFLFILFWPMLLFIVRANKMTTEKQGFALAKWYIVMGVVQYAWMWGLVNFYG